MSFKLRSGTNSFEQIRLAAEGLVSENYPRDNANTGSALVDGTVYYMGIGVFAGVKISNINVVVSGTATAITLSKVGLYVGTNRVAVSADQGTSWQAAGLKTIPLIASYTPVVNGLVYVAIVAKATTTLPSMLRDTTQGNLATAIGSGSRPFAAQTGQTDLPATAVFSGAGTIAYWVGVS